jgi:hypothetical protein
VFICIACPRRIPMAGTVCLISSVYFQGEESVAIPSLTHQGFSTRLP